MLHPAIRVLVWAAALTRALAQSPASHKQFDVAAIKLNTSDDRHFELHNLPGGNLTATGVTLKMLLMQAYNMQSFQISAGPAWMNIARWDIRAKTEGMEGRLSRDEFNALLRALMEDRFQLMVHRETRAMPIYALLVTKTGPKLIPHGGESQPGRLGRGWLSFNKSGTAALARELSLQMGRMVIDKTELTGDYDYELHWTPEPGQAGAEAVGLPPEPSFAPEPVDANGLSIFTALPEQLGLRLESQKGPVEMLVIDHVEKASEN
jgi:uncharacterized protein (TIGR03435 family)